MLGINFRTTALKSILRPGAGAGGGGASGISVVQSVIGVVPGAQEWETVNLVGAQENDIVFVFRGADVTRGAGAAMAGYTSHIDTGGNLPQYDILYKVMGPTPDTTVDVERKESPTINSPYIVLVMRGVDTTTPFDVATVTSATPSGNVTNLSFGQITTVTDGAWIGAYGVLDDKSVTVSTWPTGYDTQQYESPGPVTTLGLAFKELATAGADTPSDMIFSAADERKGCTFALRPAA